MSVDLVMKCNGEIINSSTERMLTWTPPPRPEWVCRINEEGYCMNIRGVVPLNEQSLIESATDATGLSDFGGDEWREPFRILVKALDEEADLNLMGRISTRSEILLVLEARLQIEDWYKRHPEINDEVISQPIIIVGQGRSGTSFLNNLLAANCDYGALLEWEATLPCPPPEANTYSSDPRIERADRLIKQWTRVTPTLEAMHEVAGNMPLECFQIMAPSFLSNSWSFTLGQVPSYDAYLANRDIMPALVYHQRVLKLLQWRNPRKHWVLKDPMHLDRLVDLLRIYPDACFVWPHRDPVRALASTISIHGTLQWARTDYPYKSAAFDVVHDPKLSAARLNAVIDQLETGVIPAKQIFSLLYADLVRDPLDCVRSMHHHFNIPLSESGVETMRAFLTRNPRDARPAHRFNIGTETYVEAARKAFNRYQDYFQVPIE